MRYPLTPLRKTRLVLGMLGLILLAMTGCGRNPPSTPHSPLGSADKRWLRESYRMDDREILRTRMDTVRNRLWVLGVDHVHVYDASSKALIRKMALPNWSVARTVCAPDLVLDRTGAAFVSSNVQSRLWRIDGDGFAITERIIALRNRERWELGFAALVFRPDGALLALTSSAGMVWRIDLSTDSASAVNTDAPFRGVCDLTEPLIE